MSVSSPERWQKCSSQKPGSTVETMAAAVAAASRLSSYGSLSSCRAEDPGNQVGPTTSFLLNRAKIVAPQCCSASSITQSLWPRVGSG